VPHTYKIASVHKFCRNKLQSTTQNKTEDTHGIKHDPTLV